MQQAWHIFKKDCRYLWREIILLLVLAIALCFAMGDILEGIGAVAVAFVLARLIHAEAIPGENQFWITRPYRWQSLLAAKLILIVTFVNLPVLTSQSLILLVRHFPIGSILPGLLWTQMLIFFGLALPIAAGAAMTPGLVPFAGIVLPLVFLLAVAPHPRFPLPFEWILNVIPLIAAIVVCPVILYWLYHARLTLLSRITANAAFVSVVLLTYLVPWTTIFAIQSTLSKQQVAVKVARDGKLAFWPKRGTVQMRIPLAIDVPPGSDFKIEKFGVSLAGRDGRRSELRTEFLGISNSATSDFNGAIWVLGGIARIDPAVYDLERVQPLTIRISLYMTIFGNARDKTIQLTKSPQNVIAGLQCYAGYANQLVCDAPFRWPGLYVSEKRPSGALSGFTRLISYSPFPAEFTVQPLVRNGLVYYSEHPQELDRSVTIDVQEPLAYVRRDLEIRDVEVGVNR
jgi:hypothetical protein